MKLRWQFNQKLTTLGSDKKKLTLRENCKLFVLNGIVFLNNFCGIFCLKVIYNYKKTSLLKKLDLTLLKHFCDLTESMTKLQLASHLKSNSMKKKQRYNKHF